MEYSDPKDYYDNLGEDELKRLSEETQFYHRLEFERTIEYLEEFLPENGRILDAGGASGRYTKWLSDNGYDVHLLDISHVQLQIATENLERNSSVTFSKQSITDIGFPSNTFDAVICTGGPLSHLIDKDDRISAVMEFSRVVKKGGPVFISVMGLLNTLSLQCRNLPDHDESAIMEEFARTGLYTKELEEKLECEGGFTQCKFFRVDELEQFLEDNGLHVSRIVGLESVTYGIGEDLSEIQKDAVRGVVDILGNDRVIADLSPHMLAITHA